MTTASLTKEELLRLLQTAKDHSEHDWLLILMTYSHGLRASEATAPRVVFRHGDQATIVDAVGSEINEGGICILANIELWVGQRIEIELTAPRSAPVMVQGVVRNRRG